MDGTNLGMLALQMAVDSVLVVVAGFLFGLGFQLARKIIK